MSQAFIQLLSNSLIGSIVFLFFYICRPLFQRYKTSMFRTIWILLAFFLLNPFHFEFPRLTQEVKIESTAADSLIEEDTGEIIYIENNVQNENNLSETDESLSQDHSSWLSQISYLDIAGTCVFGIGAALLAFQLFGYFWFHRLLKDSSFEIGRKKIPVVQSDLVDSPLLTGIFRPVIAVPCDLLNHPHLELMLNHELTHYEHHDLWVKFLWMTVRCFHWMNPLVYLMEKQCSKDLEMACDEAVLKNADEDERQLYAQTLLDMVSKVRFAKAAFTTQFSSDDFKIRIRAVFESGRKKFGHLIVALVLMVMAVSSAAFTIHIVYEEPVVSIYHLQNEQKTEILQLKGKHMIQQLSEIHQLNFASAVFDANYEYTFEFEGHVYELVLDERRLIIQKDQSESCVIKNSDRINELRTVLKLEVHQEQTNDSLSEAPVTGRMEEGPFLEKYYTVVLDELKQIEGVQQFVLSETRVHITSRYTDIRYDYYDGLINFYLVDYPISYVKGNENKNAVLDMSISFWESSRPHFDGKLVLSDGTVYPVSFDLDSLTLLDNEEGSKTYGQPTKFLEELNQKMIDVIVKSWNQCVMQYQVFAFWQDQMMAAYDGTIAWSEIQDARTLNIDHDLVIEENQ